MVSETLAKRVPSSSFGRSPWWYVTNYSSPLSVRVVESAVLIYVVCGAVDYFSLKILLVQRKHVTRRGGAAKFSYARHASSKSTGNLSNILPLLSTNLEGDVSRRSVIIIIDRSNELANQEKDVFGSHVTPCRFRHHERDNWVIE